MKERAEEKFYPASIFKVFSSLIGLKIENVINAYEVFHKYDGKRNFLKSWTKDSNLSRSLSSSYS